MNKALKIGGVVLVALVLVAGGVFLLQRQQSLSNAEEVAPTAAVTRGNIGEAVSATGNVGADRQATLAFVTSGSIAEVLVEKGQEVESGEELARLDTTTLEWQVARAQASLDTAQARLEQAQKPASAEDIASAQAALDSAVANYKRVEEGPSAEDIASAQAALDSARAN
jgi:HlyD family secretion protein